MIDSGTIGDGIGSATETLTSSSETSYCVIASLAPVANGGGPPTPNQFYRADALYDGLDLPSTSIQASL